MAQAPAHVPQRIDITQSMPTIQKLRDVRTDIESFIFERERIIKAIVIATLAKEHMLLVGPPGTAKSMAVHQFVKRIKGANMFETLMHPMLTDRDLFVSRTDIEETTSKGKRSFSTVYHTDGVTLATADVAFLDEIYKANPRTLNALLTLLNERMFDLNRIRYNAALTSAFFASNELPEIDGSDGLAAFHDRILLRAPVKPIKEDANKIAVIKTQLAHRHNLAKGNIVPIKEITLAELTALQNLVPLIYVPEDVMLKLLKVTDKVSCELDIYISQRRIERVVPLMQAKALLSGRNEVDAGDLSILRFCLWDSEENFEKAEELIRKNIFTPEELRFDQIKSGAFELVNKANKTVTDGNMWSEDIDEYFAGIRASIRDLEELRRSGRGISKGLSDKIQATKQQLLTEQQALLAKTVNS